MYKATSCSQSSWTKCEASNGVLEGGAGGAVSPAKIHISHFYINSVKSNEMLGSQISLNPLKIS